MNIGNHQGPGFPHRLAADPLAFPDPGTGGESLKGTEHQFPSLKDIKTRPVNLIEVVFNEGGHIGQGGDQITFILQQGPFAGTIRDRFSPALFSFDTVTMIVTLSSLS
jgi:hypothetical protein